MSNCLHKERNMQDQANRLDPEKKILDRARIWRRKDRIAIADKTNRVKGREEYNARQQLRDAIDQAQAPAECPP
jgi:hypothetical protein